MAKTVTIRMDNEAYRTLVKCAEGEARPLGKYIEMAALQYSRQAAFVDDEEMEEILRDQGLIRRLKQGIADAKAKRGKLVTDV